MSVQKFELPWISFFLSKEMASLEPQNSKGFPKCVCLVCIFCVMLASCSYFTHNCLTILKSRRECAWLKEKIMFPNIKNDPLVIFLQNSNCGLNVNEEDPFNLPWNFTSCHYSSRTYWRTAIQTYGKIAVCFPKPSLCKYLQELQ